MIDGKLISVRQTSEPRMAIHTVIGVHSGAELKRRIEGSAIVLSMCALRLCSTFGHFNFFEVINLGH